jgi:hypothetical protein
MIKPFDTGRRRYGILVKTVRHGEGETPFDQAQGRRGHGEKYYTASTLHRVPASNGIQLINVNGSLFAVH